ncbi:sulfurtransferase [Pseudomonas alcaligenes]|uniref:Sulfurtransferase n=1 Tax=Aquipseudomonas alcaligenes TaxID=43263 RepID=A0ABR7RX01_AQUAC|nr:PQQ-dependent catabolism-associated CXXCW motif protein [Pseudomonas alcaligenes]MBC9249866.1 sulfurtransferase [Pseudomonas alcaligenes]
MRKSILTTLLPPPLLALCLLHGPAMAEPEALFNAEGYRQSQYRSPTPASAEGARTLDTAALLRLLHEHPEAVLVDVFRQQWLNQRFVPDQPPHANLPGSIWLANTGDGNLEPLWRDYFADNLARASDQRSNLALVFYCKSDCWLSWNAVKRARALGYSNLYWYRDGIDAWQQAGLPLNPAEPVALP